MRPFPALDFILLGEPDLTIRDLLDHLDNKVDQRPRADIQKLFAEHDPTLSPAPMPPTTAAWICMPSRAWSGVKTVKSLLITRVRLSSI